MRVFALIVIDLIFFLLVGPVLLAFNFQSTLLSSPKIIKKSLSDSNAYSRITSLTADDLTKLLPEDERDPQSQISTEQLQQILAAIPAETAQKVVEQGLDAYFMALKNGSPTVAIDIREIKAKAFTGLPAEAMPEINQSVPDTYSLKINKTAAGVMSLALNGWVKYLGLAFLAILLLLSLLLGSAAKGKLRAVATTILLGAAAAAACYYLLRMLPLERLLNLSDNATSQKLIVLLQDIVKGLLAPVINLFRQEYLGAIIASILFFIVSFMVPGRKVLINATPQIPSHMVNNSPTLPPAN